MDIFDELMSTGKWAREQIQLGVEFEFKCVYCGKDLLAGADNNSDWQIDHIIPSSKGGADTIENFALCCRTCNFFKGKRNPADFLGERELTKGNLIEVARSHISEKREQMRKDVDVYRAIVAKYRDNWPK